MSEGEGVIGVEAGIEKTVRDSAQATTTTAPPAPIDRRRSQSLIIAL